MFVNFNRATAFIIQLGNQFGIAGAADLLGLPPSELLCRIVKRFADITGGARKPVNDLARGFMGDVPNTAMRLGEHLRFASLQPLPLPRAFGLGTLGLLAIRQSFVAVLHGGFRGSPTDQDGLLPIRGSKQRIDAKVHTNDGLLWHGYVINLADESDSRHAESHFHQASWHSDRDDNAEPATRAVGQQQVSIAEARILVRIHHVAISGLLPGIPRFLMAVLAELACAVHCLAKLAKDLLGTLGTEPWVPAFRPARQAFFAGPLQPPATYPVVAFHQITPQASGFLARSGKCAPFGGGVRHPMYFYRAITHAMSIRWHHGKVNEKTVAHAGQRALHPQLNTKPCSSWSTAREI